MNFELFKQQEIPRAQADTFTDADKNQLIVTKLFEKRKAILLNLENCEASLKNTYEEELKMNDLDMDTFGLTKIDFEVYLAKNKGSSQQAAEELDDETRSVCI